jgi:hypothetical protein
VAVDLDPRRVWGEGAVQERTGSDHWKLTGSDEEQEVVESALRRETGRRWRGNGEVS